APAVPAAIPPSTARRSSLRLRGQGRLYVDQVDRERLVVLDFDPVVLAIPPALGGRHELSVALAAFVEMDLGHRELVLHGPRVAEGLTHRDPSVRGYHDP